MDLDLYHDVVELSARISQLNSKHTLTEDQYRLVRISMLTLAMVQMKPHPHLKDDIRRVVKALVEYL